MIHVRWDTKLIFQPCGFDKYLYIPNLSKEPSITVINIVNLLYFDIDNLSLNRTSSTISEGVYYQVGVIAIWRRRTNKTKQPTLQSAGDFNWFMVIQLIQVGSLRVKGRSESTVM